MGKVQSTRHLPDGELPSRSIDGTRAIARQRIGDSNYTVTYGTILRSVRPGTPMYRFPTASSLPTKVDLRQTACAPYFPAFHQHNSGSCTSQVVSAALMCAQRRRGPRAGVPFVRPSTMYNYYFARALEGAIQERQDVSDTGTSLRSAMDAAKLGMASEQVYPFNTADVNRRPPAKAQTDALKRSVVEWVTLEPSLTNIRAALASGVAVLMAFAVTEAMDNWFVSETAQRQSAYLLTAFLLGITDKPVGAHSVLLVGYDDDYLGRGALLARNSWGHNWGQDGHFWFEYNAAFYPDLDVRYYALVEICDSDQSGACVSHDLCAAAQGNLLDAEVCEATVPRACPSANCYTQIRA